VATLGDAEERLLPAEHAPQRAPLAGRAPTGLVDVDGGRGAHVIAKPGVRLLERGARTLHDGIDRSARETATEELAHELRSVAPRDAVPDREGGDRRLEARAEGSRRHLGRQFGARRGAAVRAA